MKIMTMILKAVKNQYPRHAMIWILILLGVIGAKAESAEITYPYHFTYDGNPLSRIHGAADPSAHVWDGTVWVYCSQDHDGGYANMDGYHAFSSTDMINWTDHGDVFNSSMLDDIRWGSTPDHWMWAPGAARKQDQNGVWTYYLYYPHNVSFNGEDWVTGVATAPTPAGPFTDQGPLRGGKMGMDPMVFVDDDGQAYIYANVLKVAKLKPDMITLAESPRSIVYDLNHAITDPLNESFGEGSYMHKKNGVYYYSYSNFHGNYQGFHAMGNSPYGPFVWKGPMAPRPQGAQDHHSVIEFGSQWYYFYHIAVSGLPINKEGQGRIACFDRLYYNKDGTIQMVVHTRGPTKILTTNAPNGSIILNPPGGAYASGTTVKLTAVGDVGYAFSGWQGSLSGSANPATLVVDSDKTVTATFVPDAVPPTPNPAQFSAAPATLSSTQISMTAVTGTDNTAGPVQYLFREAGGKLSGWQSSPVYIATNLQPATQYTYTVTMRDLAGNETASSGSFSAYTYGDPDIVKNNYVDIADFAALVARWLEGDCYMSALCAGTDLNADGLVNLKDFQMLAFSWLSKSEDLYEEIWMEAENYTVMSGIQTETTSDTGGGLNIGWIENGDWAEYTVNVKQAGTYPVDFRVASGGSGGTINLLVGGLVKGTATVTGTGGWQSWQTVSTTVTFDTAGTQTVRLNFIGGTGYLYNINWFKCVISIPSGFQESGGQVCMEAEHYDSIEQRNEPAMWVQASATSGSLGDGYMWTVDGAYSNTPSYTEGTRMLYSIIFSSTGTFNVYVRRYCDPTGSNSAWVGLDGVSNGNYDNTADYDQWIWKQIGAVTVSTPGVKTFDIVRREQGYKVDRIVLTKGGIPTGTGPAESPR